VRALTRLADGSARPRDRAAFESYAAISPAAHQELERQRRVAALVRAGGPQMPADLRRRLLAKPPDPAAAGSRRRAGRSPATLWAPAVVAFALLVAVVATGAWRLTAGGARESPTIARVAMLALRDPTSALPHPAAGQPSSVGKPFAGVTFPDYQRAFGVDAWGQRTDVTGNRTIRTVYYRLGDGVPISYSVVSGASLPVPPSAHHVLVAGVRITSYTEHRLSVVTLIRHGRTCVLAGAAPARTILALAAAPLLTPARV
jgi:hypothetical protein